MDNYKTEQEQFWAGQFGNEYTDRNNSSKLIAANISLFATILSKTQRVESMIEFGANRGLNLIAIKNLIPDLYIDAVEINQQAAQELKKLETGNVYNTSIFEFDSDKQYDFVLSKGVLIHLNPLWLNNAYRRLYYSSKRYICLVEYYNPTPVEVEYRGNKNKLFKRDFAGEMLDQYPDLSLIDYGFNYHRDNNFPQGDSTWFLLEKKQ